MANIIHLYSEYQRNKWFPQTYPDPFGELIDYINEDAIRGIIAESKKVRQSWTASDCDGAFPLITNDPFSRFI